MAKANTFDPDNWEPVVIGPTWTKTEDGKSYVLPELTLGWECARFAAKWLQIDDGEGNLKPFQMTNEQLRFVLWFYAIDESGKFLYQRSLLQRLKGWGKDPLAAVIALFEAVGPCRFSHIDANGEVVGRALKTTLIQIAAVSQEQPLALSTPVNTTRGWSTVGELTVGDFVYDENGTPQEIVSETPVMNGHKVYDVTFDDGQVVRASANHGWTVLRNNLHTGVMEEATLSTQDIVDFIAGGEGLRHKRRVAIPTTVTQYPESTNQLLDPYWLGYWLGDGNSYNSGIYVGKEDHANLLAQLEAICAPDEHVSETGSFEKTGTVVLTIKKTRKPGNNRVESVYQKLKAEGLVGGKFIPEHYLRASEAQRRALLQGMVDSDGHCVGGKVQFTNKNPRLIEGFVELARSLGYKPLVHKAHGGARYVRFVNHDRGVVARLPRKQKAAVDFIRTRRGNKRYITSITEVASEPVKCIGIDTDRHLFQVAGGILTHNSRNTSDMFRQILTDEAIDFFSFDIGKEVTYARGGKAQIVCVTSNPLALEGKRPTLIICNEAQNWIPANRGQGMYGVLNGNNLKAPAAIQCHMLIIANAPVPGRNSVSEELIQGYNDTLAGRGDDRGFLYDSLEAPANATLDREVIEAVVEKVRGDSVWLDPSVVAGDFFDRATAVSEARRKWFNQTVADSDAIFDKEEIDFAFTDAGLLPGDEITLGFDGGRKDDSTALVAIRVRDRVAFLIRLWEKPRGAKEWLVPREQVHSAVHDTFSRYRVRAFFADVALWESDIMGWSADYGSTLSVRSSNESAIAWDMRGAKRTTAAHERMVHAIKNGRLKIARDQDMLRHIGNVRRRVNIHGLSFAKESEESMNKIDAYAAMLLAFEALHVLTENRVRKPEKRARTGRVSFF